MIEICYNNNRELETFGYNGELKTYNSLLSKRMFYIDKIKKIQMDDFKAPELKNELILEVIDELFDEVEDNNVQK